MNKKYIREITDLIRGMKNIDYIKPEEIPNIDLYMDQVTTFMDEHLSYTKRFPEDKTLTKTMINNYTKNDLLPPPDKKKYSDEHIILLILIYYLKNFLSIKDIRNILSPLSDHFQNQEGKVSLKDVYEEIVPLQERNIDQITGDVIHELRMATKAFDKVTDTEDKDMLTTFAFIALLSFDVWTKKSIIENIIDEFLPEEK